MKGIVKGNSVNRERKNGVERPGRHQQSVDGVGGRVAVFTPLLPIFFLSFFGSTSRPQPGIPMPQQWKHSLTHWTTMEVLRVFFFNFLFYVGATYVGVDSQHCVSFTCTTK